MPIRRVKKSLETVYLCECAGEVRKNKLDTDWWTCQDCKRQYNESVLKTYCELIEEE